MEDSKGRKGKKRKEETGGDYQENQPVTKERLALVQDRYIYRYRYLPVFYRNDNSDTVLSKSIGKCFAAAAAAAGSH